MFDRCDFAHCSSRPGREILLLVMLAAASLAADARAALVAIGAAADTTIFRESNNAYGAGTWLIAGSNGSVNNRRGLLQFDVAGAIPAGSVITGVHLTLTVEALSGQELPGTLRAFALHRVNSAWGEGTAGTPADGGGGAAPTVGSATWNHTFYDTASWSTAGGDFNPTASASAMVGTVVGADATWGSTSAMVADVQAWLDTPAGNFGWILIGEETGARTLRRFHTSEAAGAEVRPELLIEYSPVPEPTSAALVVSGLVAIVAHCVRRR